MNWRNQNCVIEGCNKKQGNRVNGWCIAHYHRWRSHGDPNKVKIVRIAQEGKFCSIDDCSRKAHSRLMCTSHYKKWWIKNQEKIWEQR